MDHLIKSELERRLKKKRAEVAALEEKITRYEDIVADWKDEISTAQITISELQSLYNLIPSADVNGAQPSFRQNSDGWLVHRLLLEAGAALYIDEILVQLGREITPDSKASLAGQLGGYVRKGQVFTRPAPNTFGLREWEVNGHKEESVEPAPLELSDDDALPLPGALRLDTDEARAANSNEIENAA